jgi:hypothetical protein
MPARTIRIMTLTMTAAVVAGAHVGAQQPPSASELAKATQNPLGDLVSLPFQFNFNSGGALENGRAIYNLNFQPVVPFRLGTQWSLIARTIVPYLNIPGPGATERVTGFGDIQEQIFLTPQKPGALIWGVGPVFSFPTATNDLARTGAWAAGPTAVLAKMTGPWVLGGLINNLWTFDDSDDADPAVNQLTVQPFINFNFGVGWSLATSPIITANWDAESGQEWTVPLGLGISKVTAIGQRPTSLSIQYYSNVERPDTAPKSQLRFVVSLLFPVAKQP